MTLPAKAGNPININPDHPALKFCSVLSNPAMSMFMYPSMWPSIQVVPFPPFVVPGMVIGLTQNTTIVTKVCNVLNQVATFDTQNAWSGVKGIANELTDNKFSEDFAQMDSFYNISNSVYDFESGTYRKGSLESAETHRAMRDFYKESYTWYNKRFNSRDAEIKTRGQTEMELNQFASLASRRAILEEASNCPDPAQAGNPDYQKIANDEFLPLQKKMDEVLPDMEFYKVKLLDMGVRIASNQEEYQAYNKELDSLFLNGVSHQINYKNKTETKKVPNPDRKNRDGSVAYKSQQVTIKTQEFQTKVLADMFQKFKKNYGTKWSEYVVIAFASTGTEGLLGDDPAARVENEFRDLSYECNPNKLMRGVDNTRVDYGKLEDERVSKCRDDVKINQKKAENLFNYYVQELQGTTYQYKKAQGDLWTKQSWHMGTMRSFNTKDSTEGYQQQTITCQDGNSLSSAEMNLLSIKTQSVTSELKEVIAKQQTKKTNLMADKQKAQSNDLKERRKRSAMTDIKNKDSKKSQTESVNTMGTIDGLIDDGSL